MITQAVLLAGGLGTRLGELTKEMPKPLLPVGGKPFLEYLVVNLARHGIRDIIISCGFQAQKIIEAFDGKTFKGATVRCLIEEEPAGTGGALKVIENELADDFLMLNADTLFDINLIDFMLEYERGDAPAWIALQKVDDASRYGGIDLAQDGTVLKMLEKGVSGSSLINAGVYALSKSVLSHITSLPCSMEKVVFPALIEKNQLRGKGYDRPFIDIGTTETFESAQTFVPGVFNRPTVFFDRDGVLNKDTRYPHKPADIEWMPGVFEAVRTLNDNGYLAIVITNQAGVARGYYTEQDVHALHAWMNEQFRQHGAHIDDFYYCLHHPEGIVEGLNTPHPDRKPNPGMLLKAFEDWGCDKSRAILIGDRDKDVEAANNAGIRGVKFTEGDLNTFVNKIAKDEMP